MDKAEAQLILTNALTERESAKQAIKQGQVTEAGMTLVIQGILRLYPDLEQGDEFEWGEPDSESSEEPPRGADAVRLILVEHPGRWYTVPQILDELSERGWWPRSENPSNATRAALDRAASQPKWNIGKGRMRNTARTVCYRYMPPKSEDKDEEEEPF